MRALSAILEVLGAAIVTFGVGLFSVPCAVIFAGVAVALLGLSLEGSRE